MQPLQMAVLTYIKSLNNSIFIGVWCTLLDHPFFVTLKEFYLSIKILENFEI